ncbi:MAG TPA: hypothetical protein VFP72_05290 [Kineosporiaceae bacterium]|nr:hypothetical protein [Kineosporiaceae bacterium]
MEHGQAYLFHGRLFHGRAYLFDAVTGTGRPEIDAMNARVAACYTWAEVHGIEILDEVIAWPGSGRAAADLLAEVLELCRRDGAALLVHSPGTLPAALLPALPLPGRSDPGRPDPGGTRSPAGQVPVLTVTGPAADPPLT